MHKIMQRHTSFRLVVYLVVLFLLDSSETPGEDVDSDGSELSTVSKISSVSMLSTQSERPRNIRKQG